jgi:hypothetical protein
MYYVLYPAADADGNMMGLTYQRDHPARSFVRGQPLADANAQPWERPPAEPLRLTIKKSRETAPLPSYLPEPVPLISEALLSVLRSAGVDNIDVYRAELYFEDGRLASDRHYVFNLIGLVQAADMQRSAYDKDQPDRLVSMGFDALAIDPNASRGMLMFRLAEHVPTVIVHEAVKRAIEAAAIPLVSLLRPDDVALI